MNKTIVIVLLVLFLGGGIAAALVFSKNQESGHSSNVHHSHTSIVTSERAFLEHMIPHHEEAIVTAEELFEQGSSLRPLHELAESIVISQSQEVEDMRSWYQLWYETPFQDQGEYKKMMRSREGLAPDLRDRVFLEDMILHHESAIESARQVLELSINPETETLATAIINTQENEIRLMKELLDLLPE